MEKTNKQQWKEGQELKCNRCGCICFNDFHKDGEKCHCINHIECDGINKEVLK
jgi:hypothetical protein